MEIIKPLYKIFYDGKDITNGIAPGIISVRYTDRCEFESDDLEIQVEDNDALYQNGWYPDKGSKLRLEYGYEGNLISAGEFEIDEIGLSGPPDVFSIRAIATGITTQLRTKQSIGYEQKSLAQIIEQVASRNGLMVKGTIEDIQFRRVTQNRETDVEFLKRLSYDFGYLFSIRGTNLIFYSIIEIDKKTPSLILNKRDMKRWSFTDKTAQIFRKSESIYQDPAKKVTYFSVDEDSGVVKADSISIKSRTENQKQADVKVQIALYRANAKQQEGSVSIIGTPQLVAGNTFSVLGFGKFDGAYVVRESSHSFVRGTGYETSASIRRAGNTDASQTSSSAKTQNYQVYDL